MYFLLYNLYVVLKKEGKQINKSHLITNSNRSKAFKNKYIFINTKEFNIKILADTNLAFSSTGSTIWELLYFKIPLVCFYIEDNQRGNADWLGKNEYCFNIGNIRNNCNLSIIKKLKYIQDYPVLY